MPQPHRGGGGGSSSLVVVVAGEGRTYECAVTQASEVPGWPSSAAGGLPPALALAACASSSTCTIEAEAFSLWRGVSLYTSTSVCWFSSGSCHRLLLQLTY